MPRQKLILQIISPNNYLYLSYFFNSNGSFLSTNKSAPIFCRPGANDFSKLVYSNTPMRAVTYVCGMLLGYSLSAGEKQPLQPWAVVLGWLSSGAVCCGVLFAVAITYQETFVYEPLEAAFYAGLHRLAWSLGLGWVVWACVHGYAGAHFFATDVLSEDVIDEIPTVIFALIVLRLHFQ
jgi:hypothetical protein